MEELEIREDGVSQFTIRAVVREIKKRLLFVVAITLLLTAIGGVLGKFFIKTTYVSKASLMVSAGDDSGGVSQAKELATTVKAFLDSTSNSIYNEIEKSYTSVPITAKEIEKSLKITVNAVMIDFTFTTKNKDAQKILQLIVQKMIDSVNETKNGEYMYAEFANKLKETTSASPAETDEGIKVFKYMAIFFMLGLFCNLLFIFLKVLLNDTYSDKDLFESDLGIDVLAMIEAVSINNAKEEK